MGSLLDPIILDNDDALLGPDDGRACREATKGKESQN